MEEEEKKKQPLSLSSHLTLSGKSHLGQKEGKKSSRNQNFQGSTQTTEGQALTIQLKEQPHASRHRLVTSSSCQTERLIVQGAFLSQSAVRTDHSQYIYTQLSHR